MPSTRDRWRLAVPLRTGLGLNVVWALLRKSLPALLVVALLSAVWNLGRNQGYSKAQTELLQYQAALAQENAKAQTLLTQGFQQTLESKDRALQDIATERDSLLSRLRLRPTRPKASDPAPSGEGPLLATTPSAALTGCSPEQLYQEDARALVLFAADAEAVRQELLSTRGAYENVRTALEAK